MNNQQREDAITQATAVMAEWSGRLNAEVVPAMARMAAQIQVVIDCIAEMPAFRAWCHWQAHGAPAVKHRHGERSPRKRWAR